MARTDNRRASPAGGGNGRKPVKPAATGWRLWLRRLFVWGGSLGLLAFVSLMVAVGLAARSLPEFDQLQASQNEQMIVVRARDGTRPALLSVAIEWRSCERRYEHKLFAHQRHR